MTERFAAAAETIVDRFETDHHLELLVLREDVVGDFRQGGPIRVAMIALLIVSALPLLVQVHYRLAGQGLELLGLVTAVLTAGVFVFLVAKLHGRPLDATSLGICNWAAISVIGGAAFAWWNGIRGPLAWGFIAAGLLMLALLILVHIQRRRRLDVAALRDAEAMDRAESLQESLRAALAAAAGSDAPSAADSIDAVVQRVVPMPKHRTFAELPATD